MYKFNIDKKNQEEINVLKNEVSEMKKEMSEINTRLTLLEYQVVAIVQDLERKAKKIVDENKISNIVPQPAKGEKEYLESLLKDKIVEPWKINLKKVENQTLDGIVDLIADSVLKVYRWNSENKKISDADHETFLKSFVDKLVDSSFAGDSNSNPKLMGVETGVKALVIAGKYMIAKSQEQKKTQDLINYWNEKKMNLIKSEIKKYLKDESEKGLEKMLNDFCSLYKINFDRDDCKLDSFSFNGSYEFNNDSPYFQRSFEKIPGFIHKTPVDSERSFELNQAYHSFGKIKEKWKFDHINFYASEEISEEDLERLNSQFNSFHQDVNSQMCFYEGPTLSSSSHGLAYPKMLSKSKIEFHSKEKDISEEKNKEFNLKLKLKAKIQSNKKNQNNKFDLIFYAKEDILQEEFDRFIYHFQSYEHYNRNYNKSDYGFNIQLEKLNKNKLKSEIGSYREVTENKFDIKNYAKDEIPEDELQKLNSQFRLYRAIKRVGEFNDLSSLGDHYSSSKTLYAGGLLFFGVGLLFGGIWIMDYFENESTWKNNISILKEMMKKCMFGFSEESLNEALKKREILSHIKIFADVTGSKYAEHFYQECLKDSYTGIEDKKLFDELYDLYSKLTNTGLTNPENHYKYSFQLQQIESNKIENPALKFVLEAIERNKNKAQGLFEQGVNDNAANDSSFLFGSSQIARTALRAFNS